MIAIRHLVGRGVDPTLDENAAGNGQERARCGGSQAGGNQAVVGPDRAVCLGPRVPVEARIGRVKRDLRPAQRAAGYDVVGNAVVRRRLLIDRASQVEVQVARPDGRHVRRRAGMGRQRVDRCVEDVIGRQQRTASQRRSSAGIGAAIDPRIHAAIGAVPDEPVIELSQATDSTSSEKNILVFMRPPGR